MSKRQVLTGGIVLAAIFGSRCSRAAEVSWGPPTIAPTWAPFMERLTRAQLGWSPLPRVSAPPSGNGGGWVRWYPTLMNNFPTAVRTTNPLGVWEKVNAKIYKFTWVAYGLGADGSVVYVARASGISTMEDRDHWPFTYVTEVFLPSQNISIESPIAAFCGTGIETRMLLVQATCPY